MSFFGFGQSVDVDILLNDADSRRRAEHKTEDGKKDKYFLFYDGETVAGKVSLALKNPNKRLEHQGIKVEFIGQIGECGIRRARAHPCARPRPVTPSQPLTSLSRPLARPETLPPSPRTPCCDLRPLRPLQPLARPEPLSSNPCTHGCNSRPPVPHSAPGPVVCCPPPWVRAPRACLGFRASWASLQVVTTTPSPAWPARLSLVSVPTSLLLHLRWELLEKASPRAPASALRPHKLHP